MDTGSVSDQEKIALPNTSQEVRGVDSKFFGVFSREVRARTFLAVFIMGMQQLGGIDGVLYVSFEFR